METKVIIVYDDKHEYRLALPEKYHGKVVLVFQAGILQTAQREARIPASEIKIRSLNK